MLQHSKGSEYETNLSAACAAWMFAAAAVSSAVAGEPEKYTLRYKFHPGETIRWEVEHRSNVRTTVSGTTQTAETLSHLGEGVAGHRRAARRRGHVRAQRRVGRHAAEAHRPQRSPLQQPDRRQAAGGLRGRGQVGRRSAVGRDDGRQGQGVAPRPARRSRRPAAVSHNAASRRTKAG